MAAPTIPASSTQAVQTTGGGTTPFTMQWYNFFAGLLSFVTIGSGGSGSGGVANASGTFTAAAAATTVVTQAAITASSKVFLQATNAAAGTLMGGTRSLYISALTPGVSFTVATASGVAAAGTETFNYVVL